jgi:gentisate 1,2-dioxygenase
MICEPASIGRRRQRRIEKERNEVSAQLGTLEELPRDYREAMARANIGPLWPQLRNVLPHGAPKAVTQPNLRNYSIIRLLLIQAGELTPVEKAERRVLFLIDPGRGAAAMQVTSTLYVGFQLLLPGETAPAHKHTPSATRIVVEGDDAFIVVDGEKLPMSAGGLNSDTGRRLARSRTQRHEAGRLA